MREIPRLDSAVRDDRNRFVAFAFAAADTLLEIDMAGMIHYAAGATDHIAGLTTQSLRGRNIVDLLVPESRDPFRTALAAAAARGRIGPLSVRIQGGEESAPAILNGSHFPEFGDHVYLTLATPRPEMSLAGLPEVDAHGLVRADDFADLALEAVRDVKDGDAAPEMTMLALDGLGRLEESLDTGAAANLVQAISDRMRGHALDGTAIGQLTGERFSLVHEAGHDLSELTTGLLSLTREADPSGRGLKIDTSTLSLAADTLNEADFAKALLYTVNQFSKQRQDFTIGDLVQAHQEQSAETVRRIQSWRRTIENEDFDVLFQPIVDIRSRQPHHYEALARLPQSGADASPYEFIRFAEETGVIGEFDLAMTARVADRIAQAADHGDSLKIAVNLSGRSLDNDRFVHDLLRLLRERPETQGHLMFEVTESAKIEDLSGTGRIINRIRSAGHAVSLDDFGAGAAAYQYLRELEVDFVKIDGVYVRDALTTPNGKAFLRSIASLCAELGINAIGEMVETEEEARFLSSAGVRFGQGYLFGRPGMGLLGRRREAG